MADLHPAQPLHHVKEELERRMYVFRVPPMDGERRARDEDLLGDVGPNLVLEPDVLEDVLVAVGVLRQYVKLH
eukprot:285589-Pyramimonas_sp.AAC.1